MATNGPPAAPAPPSPPAPSGQTTDLGGATRFTPSGDPEGQEAREAAAAQGGTAEAPKVEGLPEGFETLEDFVKAVNEGTYTPPKGEGEEDGGGLDQSQTDALSTDPRAEPFAKEFNETGTLTDESVASAATAFGVSEDIVRAYVAGQAALAQTSLQPFQELAGGPDQYRAFQEWTAQDGTITAAEESALNKALDADPATALIILKPLIDRWQAGGGGTQARDLTRQGGTGGPASGGDTFQSFEQLTAAQRDPRYESDPAYRKSVEDKLARSNI